MSRLRWAVPLCFLASGDAVAGAGQPLSPPAVPALPPSADGGFHLEHGPVIDDVFGDSGEYRRKIDRFLELSDAMQKTRDEFARSVQASLAEVTPQPGERARQKRCPEEKVAVPYGRALKLGQGYLRTGRELTRHYEQVKEFDRLGETVGLTPDYRAKVKRVFAAYGALLVDYREMKVAFHDQLSDELKFAGCNLDSLIARAGAGKEDPWPTPGPLGATVEDKAEGAGGKAVPIEPETVAGLPAPVAGSSLAPFAGDRSGILFYVDNTKCGRGSKLELDGHAMGEVPPATRVAFQSTPGPHDLCLLADDPTAGVVQKRCGEVGTTRRSYLHEGWTISLRCE